MEIGTPRTEILQENLGRIPRPFDKSIPKAIVGKPLRQNPVYSNFEQSVLGRDVVKTLKEAITKIEKREGAKQLATNLRKYHKI